MINLNNLFFLIENTGTTKSKVSADTGISTGNISDWKSGRSMPSAAKLGILADYFNVSIDYLLGRDDKIPTSELSENERKMLGLFRKLSDVQQERIIERAMTLAESSETD